MKLSIQKATYILLFVIASAMIAIHAGNILKPMVFAVLAATIYLKPAQWIEKRGLGRAASVLLTLLLGTVILTGFGYLLANETVQVMTTLKTELNIDKPSQVIAEELNSQLNSEWLYLDKNEVSDTFRKWLGDVGVPFISNTFKSTGYIISNAALSMIYTFFILLYRRGIVESILKIWSNSEESDQSIIINRILKTGQQYVGGLAALIVLLSILYAITFWAFGLEYAIVFAVIAATLAVIPYIGTTLGASLPVVYAYLSYENHYIALGLIACIMTIQMLEGNFLTPKIVGGSMKLNPFVSLLAVVFGNFIWGLAGMILFLPLAAMLKIVLMETNSLHPIGELMGQNLIKPEQKDE
ncbi:hypothetical protein BFP97_15895 [Roseivirga sp. 4D4]|uniref:AI-2E family transporter n=1 Tax=Roseivirga sp. 4D4 TaxID=1889784 RepID=UPI000852DE2D|nr:AI-2E family transporter [Roseivirga sp. 4D4]OEK02915.1 hypothetical protein BFP97_15895 [Roseivirga sp. 4D4]